MAYGAPSRGSLTLKGIAALLFLSSGLFKLFFLSLKIAFAKVTCLCSQLVTNEAINTSKAVLGSHGKEASTISWQERLLGSCHQGLEDFLMCLNLGEEGTG